MPEFEENKGFKMKGWSGWSPLKSRKDLREAKKEAKATGEWKDHDKNVAGWDAMASKKVRRQRRKTARKEYRDVKRSIRKGEYEGSTKSMNVGGTEIGIAETPSEALLKAKQKINTAKEGRKQARKTRKIVEPMRISKKDAKKLPSSSHLDPDYKITKTFRKTTGIEK